MATATKALVVTKRRSSWSGRRPKARRWGRGKKIPLLPLLGLIPGITTSYNLWQGAASATDARIKWMALTKPWLGIQPVAGSEKWKFFWEDAVGTRWLLAGVLGHMLAGRLGINRRISKLIPIFSL